MFNSLLTFYLYSIFISIQKIFDELNQCYIMPISQIFSAWIGAWGWFSFREWLTTKGCFTATWGVHFFCHLVMLWIFSSQSLRIEMIILDEYWFTKKKPALGCPRKASFFIIRTDNLQRYFFSILSSYLPTI